MYRLATLTVLVSLLGAFAVAQSPDDSTSVSTTGAQEGRNNPTASTISLAAPIADSASAFELLHTRYRFENDGTGNKEVLARIRILNYTGAQLWSELSFNYKPSKERIQILYVYVLKKDGNVVNVDADLGPRPRGIFREGGVPGFDFSDKRVTIPPLSPGDTIEYDVETVVHTALTQGQFSEVYSFRPCVVLDEQLDIDVPADRAVSVKTKPGLRTSVSNQNGRRIYRWNAPHSSTECDAVQNLAMNDVVTRTPDVQISSFASWQEVGRWYAEMAKSRRVISPRVRSKADELTQGLSTDLEKVSALYEFTAKQIKYLSIVSFGMGGYEPHTADEVLQTQYGDCKDKDTLLNALLEAKGFHASSVLINPIRELDLDLPSLWPFTHVITMLQLGNDQIWMDTSTGVVPFRMLPYPLRKKKALVIPPGGIPHFEDTPAEAPILSTWTEEVDGKVDLNGAMEGTVNITARGDAEIPLREVFLNAIERARPGLVLRAIITNFSGQVSNIRISDPRATDDPFTLSFQFNEDSNIIETGRWCESGLPLLNFNMAPLDGAVSGERYAGRAKQLRVGPVGEYVLRLRLDLSKVPRPHAPQQINLERDFGTYRANYKFEGNSLIGERRLVIAKDEIPASLTDEYRTFGQQVLRDWQSFEIKPSGGAQ